MSKPILKSLTEQQALQFKLNGFLVVKDVLDRNEVEIISSQADLIASGTAKHIPKTSIQLEKVFRNEERAITNQILSVRKLYNLAVYDSIMWNHVSNEKIVDIVADLLETSDIKMYGDQLFMKAPDTGTEQPWHQDSGSWRDIFPMDLITAWTAIDSATPENGCLNFIPGTHRWGMMRRNQVEPFLDNLGSDPWPIIPVPICSGSISFHHSLVLHQSNANRSGKRRRGYAVHYMRANSWKDNSITDAPKMPQFKQVRGQSLPERV